MMNRNLHRWLVWSALALVFVAAAGGCGESGGIETTTPEPTVSPSEPEPTNPPTVADLTALKTIVKRIRAGNSERVLDQDESVGVQVNDQIDVDQQGRGLIKFEDQIEVEVFRGSQLELSEARLDPGGSIFARLKQVFGHTRTELNAERDARLTLETSYATITSADRETEVAVCHAPDLLTCVVAINGKAEVEAQSQVVTIKGGEATYVFPDEPPQPPICVKPDELRQWLDRYRGTDEVEDLGTLVASWPQVGCSAERISETPTPTYGPPGATPTASPTSEPMPSPTGMVPVPSGTYTVGADQEDENHSASQEIELSEFWIDAYEVTNAQYAQYLSDTGVAPPDNWSGSDDHPVSGVTWSEAVGYCEWADKRLPTEAEWEVAARGPGEEPPLYPWGDDPWSGGQTDTLPLLDTYAVGAYEFNRSPFEVYDMAGNVWEWVGEAYGPLSEGYNVVRGGRYGFIRDMAYRQETEPDDARFVDVTGFRCAVDVVQGE
jgi:formylglycine-generating enzyme required for sulfatase activity